MDKDVLKAISDKYQRAKILRFAKR